MTTNLVEGLATSSTEFDLALYSCVDLPANHRLRDMKSSSPVRFHLLRGPSLYYESIGLPRALRRDDVDVFVSPVPETVLPRSIPTVLFVHDAIGEICPAWLPMRLRAWRRAGMYKRNARTASTIICPSENTKRDAIRFYGVPAEKIRVAPYATDPNVRRVEKDKARHRVRERFALASPFILMVNTVRFADFLLAYAQYSRDAEEAAHLVIVGKPKRELHAYERLLRQNGIADRVSWLTGVSDEELSNLYSACSAFACPSYYEGFGLAALEAMSCGAPTVAYSSSSLPEVVGDAGILISPPDVSGMANALADLVASDTCGESAWSAKGSERARLCTWDALVAEVGAAITSLAPSSR